MRPPLAITAWQPTMTLLTRAIIAKTAASEMSVVEMPASARLTAVCRPSPPGAVSATMTSKVRFLCAALRKASTAGSRPCVRMTSFEWMCSIACSWLGLG